MPSDPSEEAQVERLTVERFGMSSAQLRRELEVEFERATPEDRAGFVQLIDQANAVFPTVKASLDRIEMRLAGARITMDELCQSVSALNDRVAGIEGALDGAVSLKAHPANGSIQ